MFTRLARAWRGAADAAPLAGGSAAGAGGEHGTLCEQSLCGASRIAAARRLPARALHVCAQRRRLLVHLLLVHAPVFLRAAQRASVRPTAAFCITGTRCFHILNGLLLFSFLSDLLLSTAICVLTAELLSRQSNYLIQRPDFFLNAIPISARLFKTNYSNRSTNLLDQYRFSTVIQLFHEL